MDLLLVFTYVLCCHRPRNDRITQTPVPFTCFQKSPPFYADHCTFLPTRTRREPFGTTMNAYLNEQDAPMDSVREKVSLIRKSVFSVGMRSRLYTYYIEKTINYPWYRWIVLVMCMALFIRRIVHANGYYLIAYSLGLYLLNLLLGFLSPLVFRPLFTLMARKTMTMIQLSFLHAMLPNTVLLFVAFPSSSSGCSLRLY